jgi:uncharacterized lipoprotein
MRALLAALAVLALAGCDTESDNARSTTGPSIEVHCDAATPVGSTTAKIVCPGATEVKKP